MDKGRYNIRAYGIYINSKQEVLVTDEFRMGQMMTKFPGGGLEPGEGVLDALKREWKEELNAEIEVLSHFYTTDFFIQSAFHDVQLISIYYCVKPIREQDIPVVQAPFDFPELTDGAQVFRWISLKSISAEDFTYPIDKKVAALLRALR